MTMKQRLATTIVFVMILISCFAGMSESAETEWVGIPWLMSIYGYEMDQSLIDEMNDNFQAQTFDCGKAQVTLREVLYDGVWMFTAATVVPTAGEDVIIIPASADMEDFIAGGYQEGLRDDQRTFLEAALEDHKQLLYIEIIPDEYEESDFYFEDHRQDPGEQSTLYSGGPVLLPEDENVIHLTIQISMIAPETEEESDPETYSFPVEIHRTASRKKSYHTAESDTPFDSVTLVITPLATHALPEWKTQELKETVGFQLFDNNGEPFPKGIPQDSTTCFLTDFPDQFIVRFEEDDESTQDVLFVSE